MSGSPKETKSESDEIHHIRFLWTKRAEVLDEFERNKGQWLNYSISGYAPESKDKDKPVLVIKANRVNMKRVPHDVIGVADTGQTICMIKGESFPYQFPSAKWIHLTAIRSQSTKTMKLEVPSTKNTSPLYAGGKTIVGRPVEV